MKADPFAAGKSSWTIPNILSVARILITPGFVVALFNDQHVLAMTLFVLAGLTDALDGFMARILNQRSRIGAMIDPLADKFLLLTSFVCLGILGWVPFWLSVLVISREAIIVCGLFVLHFSGVNIMNRISPSLDSKINTFLLISLLLASMFAQVLGMSRFEVLSQFMAYLAGGTTVFSGVRYVLRGFSLMREIPES
ncbi:MAG: CDP-alcohol phosphatidyltransferase family protein [Desulfonatronovibrionaceae bacterium]